jgi:hypothetical protein
VNVDDFDNCVIRNTIQDFSVQEKSVPSIPKLLPTVKEIMHFPWGPKSIGRDLKRMGRKWRRFQSKHNIFIERTNFVEWRSKYLVRMKQCQEERWCTLYVDELWVNSNLTFRTC